MASVITLRNMYNRTEALTGASWVYLVRAKSAGILASWLAHGHLSCVGTVLNAGSEVEGGLPPSSPV